MKEYTVIEANTIIDLKKEVNNHLKDGWHLHGGLTALLGTDQFFYYQPMCKWVVESKEDN